MSLLWPSPTESPSYVAPASTLTTSTSDAFGASVVTWGRVGHLSSIADEAACLLSRRFFFQWLLWTHRRRMLRTLQRRVLTNVHLPLARQTFHLWGRYAADRARRRQQHNMTVWFAAHVARARALVVFTTWQQHAAHRIQHWQLAEALAVSNALRLARLQLLVWHRRRNRSQQLIEMHRLCLRQFRTNAHVVFEHWRQLAHRQASRRAVQVSALKSLAAHCWLRWREWASKQRVERAEVASNLHLARHSLQRWQAWCVRQRLAHRLDEVNTHRFLLWVLGRWVWSHRLRMLGYTRKSHRVDQV